MTEQADGYTRAWQAMGQLLDDAEGDEVPVTELLQAALASGGVVERDAFESVDRSLHDASSGWEDAAARVRRLEAALRDVTNAIAVLTSIQEAQHRCDRDLVRADPHGDLLDNEMMRADNPCRAHADTAEAEAMGEVRRAGDRARAVLEDGR